MRINSKDFWVRPGEKIKLREWPTVVRPFCKSKKAYRKLLEEHVEKLSSLQQLHYASKCAAYNLGVLLRKVWGMRKPRNADEGVWGGLLADLAWLTLAAVIVCWMTSRSDSLLWDVVSVVLITSVMGAAFEFMNRSRKTAIF